MARARLCVRRMRKHRRTCLTPSAAARVASCARPRVSARVRGPGPGGKDQLRERRHLLTSVILSPHNLEEKEKNEKGTHCGPREETSPLRLRGSGRATAGRGASERPFLLPSCQARLPAAVKYHHGLLSGPPMSRRGPRGREGANELWRFGWGSCSITEPAYDGSMNRNSLEADQNLPPGPAPTQVHEG